MEGKHPEGSKAHEAQAPKEENLSEDRRPSDDSVNTDDTTIDPTLLGRLHRGEVQGIPSSAAVTLPPPTQLQQIGQQFVERRDNRVVPQITSNARELLTAPTFYPPARRPAQTTSSSAAEGVDEQLLERIQRGELSPAIPRDAAAEYFSHGDSALQSHINNIAHREQEAFVAQYFTTRPSPSAIPRNPPPMNIPYFPAQQHHPNPNVVPVQTFIPAPSIVPYGYPVAMAANQGYPHWTVDANGAKKDCYTLLVERLEREHAGTLSEESHAYAKAQGGRMEIVLAERGVPRNFPYANLDYTVQESNFSVGATIYSMSLADLKDAVLGVEATSYLQHMLDDTPTNEPLLAALGGDPIALKAHIENDLNRWKENKMRPLFVFDGQSVVGKDEMALRQARAALTKTQKAWDMYSKNQPEEAVRAFGASGSVRAQDLYRLLQEVLDDRKLEYLIAPFSACAQLAYLDRLDEQLVDGVMGSKELLLYDIVDSMFNHPTAADWEKKQFTGIYKSELVTKLNTTPEMLADALLMVGTSFLSPFPPLQVESIISSQPYTLTDAINLLRTSDKSVTNTCVSFHDILEKRDPDWLDKYRKAKMAVKHCITVDVKGNIHIREYDNLTNDQHLYLGLQMPAELYHYLSKALIGPTIMNCFVHRDLIVLPTLDGFASDEYKKLVSRDLVPLKETTAALISSRIHRAIQHYEIVMKFWFDDSLKQTIVHRNLQPQTNQKIDPWGVKDKELKAQATKLNLTPGSLAFAILSLEDGEFRAKTFRKPDVVLEGKSEISASVLWRLLHLRNYINDQHELTSYGKALAAILKSIGPRIKNYWNARHVEEAAFLAMELIRFDILNSRNRHNDLIGGALRGSDEDKANCILIGRTACLLKLRHAPIGYTGPLSKNFLNFHSMIKAVRETDRDLLEAVLASMLLNAQAVRPNDDCGRLGRSLPLCTDVDTSLGIAVKTYLDDFFKAEWSAEERKEMTEQYVDKYLPHSVNFPEDLNVAFKFFDAVYEGVSQLGDEVSQTDKTAWENAKAYLDKRH